MANLEVLEELVETLKKEIDDFEELQKLYESEYEEWKQCHEERIKKLEMLKDEYFKMTLALENTKIPYDLVPLISRSKVDSLRDQIQSKKLELKRYSFYIQSRIEELNKAMIDEDEVHQQRQHLDFLVSNAQKTYYDTWSIIRKYNSPDRNRENQKEYDAQIDTAIKHCRYWLQRFSYESGNGYSPPPMPEELSLERNYKSSKKKASPQKKQRKKPSPEKICPRWFCVIAFISYYVALLAVLLLNFHVFSWQTFDIGGGAITLLVGLVAPIVYCVFMSFGNFFNILIENESTFAEVYINICGMAIFSLLEIVFALLYIHLHKDIMIIIDYALVLLLPLIAVSFLDLIFDYAVDSIVVRITIIAETVFAVLGMIAAIFTYMELSEGRFEISPIPYLVIIQLVLLVSFIIPVRLFRREYYVRGVLSSLPPIFLFILYSAYTWEVCPWVFLFDGIALLGATYYVMDR